MTDKTYPPVQNMLRNRMEESTKILGSVSRSGWLQKLMAGMWSWSRRLSLEAVSIPIKASVSSQTDWQTPRSQNRGSCLGISLRQLGVMHIPASSW